MSRLARKANTPKPSPRDLQIVVQDGRPRFRDPNGVVSRIRPEPGSPGVPGVPGDMVFDEDGLHILTVLGWETLPFAIEDEE